MSNRFLYGFLFISVASSMVRGMSLFVINLYALHLGANLVELGLIRGISGLGILLTVLPVGFLVDRYGAKKFYIIGELFGALLNLSLVVIATPGELITRNILIGFTMALRFTPLQTIFLGQLDAIGKRKAGWHRGSTFLGLLFLGPLLGGYLVKFWDYHTIFIVTTLFMLLIAGLGCLFLPEASSKVSGTSQPETINDGLFKQFGFLFGNKVLVRATLFEGLNAACFSIFSTFILAVAIGRFHLAPNLAGDLVSSGGAAFMVVVFLGGYILTKENHNRLMLTSFAVIIGGLLLLAMADNQHQLLLGTLLLCLSLGMTTLITFTQISGINGKKGKIIGFYATSSSLGHTFGPIVGGVIGKWYGPQAVFLSMVPLFFLFGLIRVFMATNNQEVLDE